ncbi:MAG: hypothetical protein M1832_006088 [Thelocarpon impressellum]|nr:MAG: hypothetical protein M1832_006088 [Thelocarpon impressellum]
MAWFSILPASFAFLETWVVRLFILLGCLTIGPWLILLAYDVALYLLRSMVHELPVVGGRARGLQRPRAPSLTERPSGRARGFSIGGVSTGLEDEGGAAWPRETIQEGNLDKDVFETD